MFTKLKDLNVESLLKDCLIFLVDNGKEIHLTKEQLSLYANRLVEDAYINNVDCAFFIYLYPEEVQLYPEEVNDSEDKDVANGIPPAVIIEWASTIKDIVDKLATEMAKIADVFSNVMIDVGANMDEITERLKQLRGNISEITNEPERHPEPWQKYRKLKPSRYKNTRCPSRPRKYIYRPERRKR